MDLQEQVRLHKELSNQIDELEAQKKELGQAIMQHMTGKVLTLPGYTVRKMSRLSIKLTIDQARALDAVKIEEAVDKDKVKELHHGGQDIDGVSTIEYIQIISREEALPSRQ